MMDCGIPAYEIREEQGETQIQNVRKRKSDTFKQLPRTMCRVGTKCRRCFSGTEEINDVRYGLTMLLVDGGS